MQIYCLKNKHTSTQTATILSTILDHCGFFYSWIETKEATGAGGLFLEYAPTEAKTEAPQTCLRIPALLPPARLSEKQSSWEEKKIAGETIPLLDGSLLQPEQSNCFNIDIIANVYYHLMRTEESGFTHPDQIDPEGRDGILYTYGGVQLPLVDILTDHFGQWLEQKATEYGAVLFKKAAWPAGQEFAVALTHDVDFIRAFHPLKKVFLKLKARAGLTRDLSAQELENQDQQHWGFEQLLSFYDKKKWQATFFFIAKYSEGRHFRYRINSRRMKALFKKLVGDNHEIALHPSRFAFEHPRRYAVEKQKLEQVSGSTVKGMRQHYLRALFPAIWEKAAALGLNYEATLCYRRKSGFRSGTCRPYFVVAGKKEIVSVPTNFFENTLPNEGADVESALQEIRLIIKHVKQHAGLLTALWHTNHILQPAAYVKIWQEFLKLLEQEKPYIATLSAHSRWIEQRRAIQMQCLADGEIEISFPTRTEEFTLLLPKAPTLLEIENPEIIFNLEDRFLYIQNKNTQKSFILNITFQ